MDVGAAAGGAVSGARSAAVRGAGRTAGHGGHRSTDRGAGAHEQNGYARAAPLAEDSDSSGEDTANVKVRKLFIPSPTEGVSVLAGIITGTAPYLDKLIAIQKLNGMFLRLKSFVAFTQLAECGHDRDLVEKLLEIAIEGEALSFFALKLLCNLAVDPVAQKHLIDLDAFAVLFGMFRSRDPERLRLGLALMVSFTTNPKLYNPKRLARAGGLKVLLKLLMRKADVTEDGMECELNRCNALLLLLRALEAKKTRQMALGEGIKTMLQMVEGHPQCCDRERAMVERIRYVLMVWEKVDKMRLGFEQDEAAVGRRSPEVDA